jgi:hypothetical protein
MTSKTLLGYDSIPLDEAMPRGPTVQVAQDSRPITFDTPPAPHRSKRSRKLAKDRTPTMTKTQKRANDFSRLAQIHARDGEAVSRTVIDAMPAAARHELHAMSHALTEALKAGPGEAGPHDMAAAHDAVPGLGRIVQG